MWRFQRVLCGAAIVVGGGTLCAEAKPSYAVKQTIVTSDGTTERRGDVTEVKQQPDGRYVYTVKMRDNGEIVTIRDAGEQPKPPEEVASKTVDPKAAFTLRPNEGQNVRGTVGLPPMPWETSDLDRANPATDLAASKRPSATNAFKLPTFVRPTVKKPVPATPGIARMPAIPVLDPLPVVPTMPSALAVTPLEEITARDTALAQEERLARLSLVLRDALLPSTREMAVLDLAEGAGATTTAVRDLLLHTAENDPAGSVRAASLRCLTKQGVYDAAYEELLSAAKRDRHPRVQEEVRDALERRVAALRANRD